MKDLVEASAQRAGAARQVPDAEDATLADNDREDDDASMCPRAYAGLLWQYSGHRRLLEMLVRMHHEHVERLSAAR